MKMMSELMMMSIDEDDDSIMLNRKESMNLDVDRSMTMNVDFRLHFRHSQSIWDQWITKIYDTVSAVDEDA
jgi:hypothetical protein